MSIYQRPGYCRPRPGRARPCFSRWNQETATITQCRKVLVQAAARRLTNSPPYDSLSYDCVLDCELPIIRPLCSLADIEATVQIENAGLRPGREINPVTNL